MLLTKLGPAMVPVVTRGMMLFSETGGSADTPSISGEIVQTLQSSMTQIIHDALIGFSGIITACMPLLAAFIVLNVGIKSMKKLTGKAG